jgi:hypothetical protein
MRALIVLLLVAPAVAKPPNGAAAEAEAIVAALVRPNADVAGLSKQLKPTHADYLAVFDAATAAKIEALLAPAWDGGKIVVRANPGQTDVRVFRATVDELRTGAAAAANFPGGYREVAPHILPGVVVFAFKFTAPGQPLGMAYDGLVFVNGHWALFPKPWRALH